MKSLFILLVMVLLMACDYQEKPAPPVPMEKIVLQEYIKDECCEKVTFRAKRLSNGTMVSLQIRKEFHSGDTVLVKPKDLQLY